mmetsp:Transcript_32681/g.70780  ORF Transcript_32681/g.70780 Transcript_32681/m.70780 type:complete len:266 (+) Transcript_32681:2350-3147(+)
MALTRASIPPASATALRLDRLPAVRLRKAAAPCSCVPGERIWFIMALTMASRAPSSTHRCSLLSAQIRFCRAAQPCFATALSRLKRLIQTTIACMPPASAMPSLFGWCIDIVLRLIRNFLARRGSSTVLWSPLIKCDTSVVLGLGDSSSSSGPVAISSTGGGGELSSASSGTELSMLSGNIEKMGLDATWLLRVCSSELVLSLFATGTTLGGRKGLAGSSTAFSSPSSFVGTGFFLRIFGKPSLTLPIFFADLPLFFRSLLLNGP